MGENIERPRKHIWKIHGPIKKSRQQLRGGLRACALGTFCEPDNSNQLNLRIDCVIFMNSVDRDDELTPNPTNIHS